MKWQYCGLSWSAFSAPSSNGDPAIFTWDILLTHYTVKGAKQQFLWDERHEKNLTWEERTSFSNEWRHKFASSIAWLGLTGWEAIWGDPWGSEQWRDLERFESGRIFFKRPADEDE
jgi:hypothetical protein